MSSCLKVKEDRYGGVELEVVAGDAIAGFARELQAGIEAWPGKMNGGPVGYRRGRKFLEC